MGKAGKLIVGGIVALIVVIGIVLVFVISNLDSIVKRAIETVGTDVAGVPVSVGSVQISLKEGTGAINGLSLGNPPGFGRGNAFELGTIALKLDVKNTSADLVTVSSLVIDGAKVEAVQNASGNNLKVIQDNLAGEDSGSAAESADSDAAGTKIIIDDLQFRNGEVSVALQGIAERKGSIPDLSLTGIGRKSNGVSASEAAKQILTPIVRSSMQAMTGISADDLKEMGQQKLNEALKDGEAGAVKELGKFLNRGKD